MPAPLPRREWTGAPEARFPVRHWPSPISRTVGSRDYRFGACTVFAYAPARMVAELLMQPFINRVLQSTSFPPQTALAAINRSLSCRAGFGPVREKRITMAHEKSRLARNIVPSVGVAHGQLPASAVLAYNASEQGIAVLPRPFLVTAHGDIVTRHPAYYLRVFPVDIDLVRTGLQLQPLTIWSNPTLATAPAADRPGSSSTTSIHEKSKAFSRSVMAYCRAPLFSR